MHTFKPVPDQIRYAQVFPLTAAFTLSIGIILTLYTGQAHAISLNSLITTNGNITQGDKRFDNFSASIDFQTGTVSPTSNGGIDVQGITVGSQLGLRFSGPFTASATSGLSALSYHIQYDMTVLNPALRIQSLQSAIISPSVIGNADAALSVEAFRPAGSGESVPSLLGVASATNATTQSGIVALSGGLVRIHVDQTLVLFAQGGTVVTESGPITGSGSVTVGSIETRFSQVNVVPEPTSLLLLGSGLLGLGLMTRRMRR